MSTQADLTTTPADVLASVVRRYLNHYGDQIAGIYALPDDPYEPERGRDEEEGVHIVVVFEEPYDHWTKTGTVMQIAHGVMDEMEWTVPLVPHHVSLESALVQRIRREGVRLD